LHKRTGEDNADAHLKRQIMGREVAVAVTNGRLDGFAERSPEPLERGSGSFQARLTGWPVSLDGRRRKRVLVTIIGEYGCSSSDTGH
jgi:hypothetical protein